MKEANINNANHVHSVPPPRLSPISADATSPTRPPSNGPYATSPPFHGAAYMPPAVPRKRGRSDSLFPPETGPFFSSTKPFDNLFALDRTTLLTLRIQSKMDRGFFLADNDWTCYRRNYFQVSSAFSIHGINHYYTEHEPPCLVRADDGMFYPVRRFLLGVSARVSNSDKRIELVQHTPKRDKGPQMTPQPKPITPGGNLSMSSVGTNQNIVTFERIQFKTATANNGKRRAAQQYYVCVTDLFAETDQGEPIKIASCQSAPLVVRGRSPGHYTDSQERPGMLGPNAAAPPPPPTPTQSPHHHHPPPSAAAPDHGAAAAAAAAAAFPRPPYTPPNMMPNDYGSPSYPYYPTHFGPVPPTMMMSHPPTPSSSSSAAPPPPPTPSYHGNGHHHHQHHHHPPPPHQHHHHHHPPPPPPPPSHQPPYMMSTGSPQSPTPQMYNGGEFAAPPPPHPQTPVHEEHKLAHPPTPNNGYVPTMDPAAAAAAVDWSGTRSRLNSTGSVPQQSPHPHHQQQQSYFAAAAAAQGTPTLSSNASQTSAFSPTTPTTPYVGARKYNAVTNICNQQATS
ncbi:hypothetical protein BDB00DRAFT_178582 [Zychaea mexicana]|uniref:uncharacterized protein n=1 Tax=Zychaea mexicana TaxID=64656 RepID=UPI0022FDE91F|nr:uncharacterized protein BDB00DRAFT_178582 [Zychaea mexicana]KAI9495955.1 hypothetical protein BDB00DRAFT_178582 [Zychaea mexicana]